MRTLLAPAHLALTAIILVWDVVLAGRIAQNDRAARTFQAMSGMCALLLIPGLLLALATSTIITGRAVAGVDWMWPVVLVLFTVQSGYALMRGVVNIAWGIPIFVYNCIITAVGVARYLVAHGFTLAEPAAVLLAAQSLAMVLVGGTSGVLMSPFYLNVPMISPAFPSLHKLTVSFRLFMSGVAVAWSAIIALATLRAVVQLRSYDLHAHDQLRERPNADFAVGLKILPDISSPPPPAAIRSDSVLLDSLDVDAITIVVVPGASRVAIDSIAHLFDPTRRDTTVTIIAAIGYHGKLLPELGHVPFDESARLTTLRRVVSRLHPDVILPAEDPYGSGERAYGSLPVEQWESYLTDAARAAKSIDHKVKIGVAASSYRTADSALYAWAASPGSPIDIVGFSLFPSPYIGGGIQSDTRTADRWMHATPSTKEHWVFATGGYPLAYGERSQEEAIWEVLSWATDHPIIKGTVVYEAGDYGQARGLRAPNGHFRLATRAVLRGTQQIRESAR